MFGRYELSVSTRFGSSIFLGYFNSINRLTKTICCFDKDNCDFNVYDVVLDCDIDPDELRKVFENESIIL